LIYTAHFNPARVAQFTRLIHPQNKTVQLEHQIFEVNNGLECLVVDIDNELVGYTTFMKQYSTWDASYYVYMDCLFLQQDFRGSGIGKLLMSEVRKYAEQNNCRQIQWQTPDINMGAIKFYKRLKSIEWIHKVRFSWTPW